MSRKHITIPGNWPAVVRRSVLHAASLAHTAIIHSRSWCADSPIARARMAGQLDRAKQEISLLNPIFSQAQNNCEKIA